jgi:TolA-binding protein
MRTLIIFILGVVLAINPMGYAYAFFTGFCNEPSEPYCIDSFGTFDDEFSFSNCRGEVQSYIDNVNDAIRCMDDEIEERINKIKKLKQEIEELESQQVEIREKANQIIERFNCKARGGSYCP